jgi:hypothetical protein
MLQYEYFLTFKCSFSFVEENVARHHYDHYPIWSICKFEIIYKQIKYSRNKFQFTEFWMFCWNTSYDAGILMKYAVNSKVTAHQTIHYIYTICTPFVYFKASILYIMSLERVTTNGVWIGNRFYWTLTTLNYKLLSLFYTFHKSL